MYQPKKSQPFVVDGHFWPEDENGHIFEPTPFSNQIPFNIGPKYYKKASPSIQNLVIEMTYRKYEECYKVTRDSEGWLEMIEEHNYRSNACFHNTIKYLKEHKDCKMVFGYVGTYNNKNNGIMPKKTVYWLYGCPKHTKVSQIIHKAEKANDVEIETAWTYEKWADRDNKNITHMFEDFAEECCIS